MKTGLIIAAVVAVAAIGFGTYMIDVDQTQETRLPDVEVEGGQMPAFDAEVGEVDMTEEEVTVTVPGVEITPPEEDVSAEEDVASN